jgi:hypothetical protein
MYPSPTTSGRFRMNAGSTAPESESSRPRENYGTSSYHHSISTAHHAGSLTWSRSFFSRKGMCVWVAAFRGELRSHQFYTSRLSFLPTRLAGTFGAASYALAVAPAARATRLHPSNACRNDNKNANRLQQSQPIVHFKTKEMRGAIAAYAVTSAPPYPQRVLALGTHWPPQRDVASVNKRSRRA